MKKEIVQNWMREAYREGNEKEIASIPAEALAILKAQEPKEAPKKVVKKTFRGLI